MRRLVCPYHQWVYNLDGSLFSARHMGEDFDKSQFGLKPVHCESVAGYIFVCVAEAAPDFAPFRGHGAALSRAARAHGREGRVRDRPSSRTATGSSCGRTTASATIAPRNHPELCRTYPEAPTATGVQGAIERSRDRRRIGQRCEAVGLPSTFMMSEDGQYRTARMPLLRDAESYTMSGKRAVAKPLSPTRHRAADRHDAAVPLSLDLEPRARRHAP